MSKIEIDLEKLRKCSIFLATPMYGGMCSGFYTKSLLDLSALCMKYGIPLQFFSLFNESLVTRARNYIAAEFKRSSCSHLMFIDSDIEFNPMDVIALLSLSEADSEKHIVGGTYPKKSISYEKIKMAVDKGFADENPFVLEQFAGDFVFNPVRGTEFRIDEPVEVMELGTGFMLIRRDVFDVWDRELPEFLYTPDHPRSKGFDGSEKIMAYFQDPICPEHNRHLSEDYFFCQQSRKLGLKVWLCPWQNLNHIGSYRFMGNLSAIAAIGAPATADMEQVKGLKK